MARYVVGKIVNGERMGPNDEPGKENSMVMFRASSSCGGPSVVLYETLPEAEKEAARFSHDHGFDELSVFQLIETVRAAEPLDTAIVVKKE
jgi:hypothetical protein